METALVDAIIQLRQLVTPQMWCNKIFINRVTESPIYQTKDERIHRILQTFVNKILNTTTEEREEKKQTSGLTKQQEKMYAME
jgi:hypothetical protein